MIAASLLLLQTTQPHHPQRFSLATSAATQHVSADVGHRAGTRQDCKHSNDVRLFSVQVAFVHMFHLLRECATGGHRPGGDLEPRS